MASCAEDDHALRLRADSTPPTSPAQAVFDRRRHKPMSSGAATGVARQDVSETGDPTLTVLALSIISIAQSFADCRLHLRRCLPTQTPPVRLGESRAFLLRSPMRVFRDQSEGHSAPSLESCRTDFRRRVVVLGSGEHFPDRLKLNGALAKSLVGDVDVTALRVARLGAGIATTCAPSLAPPDVGDNCSSARIWAARSSRLTGLET
jgi:hypothetical protein